MIIKQPDKAEAVRFSIIRMQLLKRLFQMLSTIRDMMSVNR